MARSRQLLLDATRRRQWKSMMRKENSVITPALTVVSLELEATLAADADILRCGLMAAQVAPPILERPRHFGHHAAMIT